MKNKRDLGEYLAGCLIGTVRGKVGNSTFRDNVFEHDYHTPSSVLSWNKYRLTFYDEGSVIRIVVDRAEGIGRLHSRINTFLQKEDKKVINRIDLIDKKTEVEVIAYMTPRQNSSGRTNDESKIYHALYRSVIKPILIATMKTE